MNNRDRPHIPTQKIFSLLNEEYKIKLYIYLKIDYHFFSDKVLVSVSIVNMKTKFYAFLIIALLSPVSLAI